MNGSRRAQFIVIGQRREQVSLHSLSLASLVFLCWHRVFSFTLRFFFLLCLWTLWLHTYTTVFDNTLFLTLARHAMSFCDVLHYQVLPSPSTYIKMCLYICNSMQMKRKELIFRVYCIYTYTYAHRKEESSYRAMIDRLQKY